MILVGCLTFALALAQAIAQDDPLVDRFKTILAEKKMAGDDTTRAEEIASTARATLRNGDRKGYEKTMLKALAVLDGKGAAGVVDKEKKQVESASISGEKQNKRAGVALGAPEDSPFGFLAAGEYGFVYTFDLGVRWDRTLPVYWCEVQKDLSKPAYDWSKPLKGAKRGPSYDSIVRDTPQGFCIYAQVSPGVPRKQENEYLYARSYLPKFPEKFADFVRATVERYDGDGKDDMPGLKTPIRHWEVINEPVDGKDYPEVLRIAYRAIKQADSNAVVHMGGTFGSGLEAFRYFKTFHRQYLEALRGEHCFDVFDVHWYGDAYGDYRLLGRFLQEVRDALKQNGYPPGIPVWIGEMSSYSGVHALDDGKHRSLFQSEEIQAADILKRNIYSMSLGFEKVFMACSFFDGTWLSDDSYFNHTGMIHDGKGEYDRGRGAKKLAYFTYKMMVEKMDGSDWKSLAVVPTGQNHVYAYRVANPARGKTIWVVWWDWFAERSWNRAEAPAFPGGNRKTISIPAEPGMALVTSAITDAKGRPSAITVPVKESQLVLEVGEYPLFVEQ